jgi:hypothetical protein
LVVYLIVYIAKYIYHFVTGQKVEDKKGGKAIMEGNTSSGCKDGS